MFANAAPSGPWLKSPPRHHFCQFPLDLNSAPPHHHHLCHLPLYRKSPRHRHHLRLLPVDYKPEIEGGFMDPVQEPRNVLKGNLAMLCSVAKVGTFAPACKMEWLISIY